MCAHGKELPRDLQIRLKVIQGRKFMALGRRPQRQNRFCPFRVGAKQTKWNSCKASR
jgi:hypothetical protein